MHRGQQLALLGALALLVGALLPWASVTSPILGLSLSKAGYEGDGMFTGAIGLLLLLGSVLYKGEPGRIYSIGTSILAFLGGVILLYDFSNISSLTSQAGQGVMTSIGPGVYLSIVGGGR